jgi:hypothetical protein
MLSGIVEVHLQYITNSSSNGCFLILTQGYYTGYYAIKKPLGRERQNAQLEGLPEGVYTVRGYEVGNGSHFYDPMVAVVSDSVRIDHGAAFWDQGKDSFLFLRQPARNSKILNSAHREIGKKNFLITL